MGVENPQLREIPTNYLDRTFHVAESHAGFLKLGVKIQMLIQGQIAEEEIVYGDTLHLIRRHVDAQVSGNLDKMIETNKALPERFRYNSGMSQILGVPEI